MQTIDWNIVSAAIAAILTGVGMWWQVQKGKAKADGTPPPERQPSPHEMREAVNGLHDHLRTITRNLDSEGSKSDTILAEIRFIREGLRDIENWQKLHDMRLNMKTSQ